MGEVLSGQQLEEKWDPMLNHENVDPIKDPYRRRTTARLLQNQEEFLSEATNVAADVAGLVPTVMGMVRRMGPKLIGYDIMGMQAIPTPVARIFAVRARYGDGATITAGKEALFDEADTDYSGKGTHAGDDPFGTTYTTGTGKDTADGEKDNWAQMGMSIESVDVSVKTRNMRTDYTIEVAQDMKNALGIDADAELANILSTEVIAEMNRELVRTVYTAAKVGTQFATTPGTFDMNVDTDGRWAGERYAGLLFAAERDANRIAIETQMGKGNILITSADVASALAMAKLLSYNNAMSEVIGLQIDPSGPTYVGTAGAFRVFVDPYLGSNGYVVGYRGSNQYDAGIFFCPYVPLQMYRGQNPVTFAPSIGYKTRYGIVANPFTTLAPKGNIYYRKSKIINLR